MRPKTSKRIKSQAGDDGLKIKKPIAKIKCKKVGMNFGEDFGHLKIGHVAWVDIAKTPPPPIMSSMRGVCWQVYHKPKV